MLNRWRLFGATVLCGAMLDHGACAADPDALWKIVSGACVPHAMNGGDGRPCAMVDQAGGYAILKDLEGATQFLLIPTARVTGIEDPALFAPGAPHYWDDAWRARHFVDERAGRPLERDEVGLAINSMSGRSQNQLHIHIDCILPAVRAALRADEAGIGTAWSRLPVAFDGHFYRARRLMQASLGDTDPFRLLAGGVTEAGADMGHETLVVTGAVFHGGQKGFYLLSDRADPASADFGSGDELLDHTCALAHGATG